MIELTENANEEVRRDIFERINTGSQTLTDMEQRWGVQEGEFLRFIRACSENEVFKGLTPLPEAAVKRRERQEFTLRFFAYLDNYQKFDRKVVDFVDQYVASKKSFTSEDAIVMAAEWERMLAFVKRHFPNGFSKAKGHVKTPRIRFEAIAVGTALALRMNPNLVPSPVENWLNSEEFLAHTTSGSSNSRPKVLKRIEYVRDRISGL